MKRVEIRLKRTELLYDIANIAFVEGDVLPQDMQHQKHQVQDITMKGNIDRVTRIMDIVFEECIQLLYPFTKEAVLEDIVTDDILKESDVYVIKMSIPDNFANGTVNLLTKLIHEFIVARVLWDWFLIVNVEKAGAWEIRANKAKENIKSCIKKRMGKVKRPLTPF